MNRWARPLGVLGALVFAATGAFWGAMNAGWFGLERNADKLQAGLGVGAGLVVAAFASVGWRRTLAGTGRAGRVAVGLLVAGPVLHVLSAVIQFAIFGTLTLGAGLVLLAVLAFRHRLMPLLDRWLVALSALASLTWNTETASVWLLVGLGLVWIPLSVRLLPGPDTT